MFHIHLVGAGALGSVFATETAKRALALEVPMRVSIYDFDTVEERNVVAQDFSPTDVGKLKAEAVAKKLECFTQLEVKAHTIKITSEEVEGQILLSPDDKHVIVDAVDNFAARHTLWYFANANEVPLLHLGMDRNGGGWVSWTYQGNDTFNLSPASVSPAQLAKMKKAKELEPLPPCELNTFRTLIFNTAISGMNALFIFLGKDPCHFFGDEIQKKQFFGTMATWSTNLNGSEQVKEMLAVGDF